MPACGYLRCGLAVAVMAGAACGGGRARARWRRRGRAAPAARADGPGTMACRDQPQRRHPVPDRRFVVDAAGAGQPDRELSDVHGPAARLPPGLPNIHIAVVSSGHGRGRRHRSRAATRPAARTASSSTRARGTCTATTCRRARRSSRTSAASRTTPATWRTCSPASRRSARRAAASSTSSRRSRARWASTAAPAPAENQGFLRPDAYLVDRHDDERGRLLRASPGVHRCSTPARTRTSRRSSARPRTSAATSSATCARRRRRHVHPNRNAPNNDVTAMVDVRPSCTSNDTEGYLLSVADTANRLKALKADPAQVARRRRSRARRRRTPSPGRRPSTRGHLVRRGVLPLAARSRIRARPATAASPIRASARPSSCRQFGGNGLCCRSARPTLRAVAGPHGDADQRRLCA